MSLAGANKKLNANLIDEPALNSFESLAEYHLFINNQLSERFVF